MYTLQPGTSKCWIQRHHEHCYGNILYLEMMLLNSKQILYFYEWLKIYVRVQGYVKLNSSCSVVTKMYTLYSSLPKNTIFRVYKSAFKSHGPIYTISSHLFVCITSFIRQRWLHTKCNTGKDTIFWHSFLYPCTRLCLVCSDC